MGDLADVSCGDAWHLYNADGNPGLSVIVARTVRGKAPCAERPKARVTLTLVRLIGKPYWRRKAARPESLTDAVLCGDAWLLFRSWQFLGRAFRVCRFTARGKRSLGRDVPRRLLVPCFGSVEKGGTRSTWTIKRLIRHRSGGVVKILVAIANYGTGNRLFLSRLIQEYKQMPWDIDIVVLSDRPKHVDSDVEVRVGLPTSDPWSLPFAHKELFRERASKYDLFIYSEDDTLITQSNIEAFLEATAVVPHPRIVGFLRYEEDAEGNRYCSSVHSHYHWVPGSVEEFGPHTVAQFSNEHAAAFILTKKQLQHAIESGGFLVPPHSGRYDLPCTAATDPYTQCGMRKVICISHVDRFLLHHLPDKYVNRLGVKLTDLQVQMQGILKERDSAPWALFPAEKPAPLVRFSKDNYRPLHSRVLDATRTGSKILSVGASSGILESELQMAGRNVAAVPIDSVSSGVLELRGLKVAGSSHELLQRTSEALDAFLPDYVLLVNVLEHVPCPEALIERITRPAIPPKGLIGIVTNFGRIRRRKVRRAISREGYERTCLQPVSRRLLESWIPAGTRLRTHGAKYSHRPVVKWLHQSALSRHFANELYFEVHNAS